MRALDQWTAVAAIDMSSYGPGPSAEADELGVQTEVDAFGGEDVLNCGRDLRVLATDETSSHLDDRDLGPEPPEHLAELQSDVAAADDDEVLRQRVQRHHRAVRQELNAVEPRHRRHECPRADVQEDAVGAQRLTRDLDFMGGAESGVRGIDVAMRQPSQHLLDADARAIGDRVLPGLDALHVDGDMAVHRHAEVSGAACQVSRVGAGHHCLRWNAAGVHARTAEKMAFDDGDRHAGLRQSLCERRPSLAGANDDCVVLFTHRTSAPKATHCASPIRGVNSSVSPTCDGPITLYSTRW